jgi:hypothetical protein
MPKRKSKKIYQCVKLNTKKYISRSSPPYSARECPNKIMKGNDGKKYISLSSELGIFRWIPYSDELIKREKRILDNQL